MFNSSNEWIDIPAGTVTLEPGGYLPAPTTFRVEPFAIARYPVTNELYARFIEAGGYNHQEWWCGQGWRMRERQGWTEPRYWDSPHWTRPDCPVVGVSWFEAMAFCRWWGSVLNRTITLPTEQQWQRAAQGDDGRFYPWGNADPNEHLCNWARAVDETTPVTRYPEGVSPFGVMDMCGNVWEWCLTTWDADGEGPRLLRGGSWSSDSLLSLRVTNRYAHDPNTRLNPGDRNHATVGFRPVWLPLSGW